MHTSVNCALVEEAYFGQHIGGVRAVEGAPGAACVQEEPRLGWGILRVRKG
jgi:hypothetical protein